MATGIPSEYTQQTFNPNRNGLNGTQLLAIDTAIETCMNHLEFILGSSTLPCHLSDRVMILGSTPLPFQLT